MFVPVLLLVVVTLVVLLDNLQEEAVGDSVRRVRGLVGLFIVELLKLAGTALGRTPQFRLADLFKKPGIVLTVLGAVLVVMFVALCGGRVTALVF